MDCDGPETCGSVDIANPEDVRVALQTTRESVAAEVGRLLDALDISNRLYVAYEGQSGRRGRRRLYVVAVCGGDAARILSLVKDHVVRLRDQVWVALRLIDREVGRTLEQISNEVCGRTAEKNPSKPETQ